MFYLRVFGDSLAVLKIHVCFLIREASSRSHLFVNFQPPNPLTILPFTSLQASCVFNWESQFASKLWEATPPLPALHPSTLKTYHSYNIRSYALSITIFPFRYVNWVPQIFLICLLPWYNAFSIPAFLAFIVGYAGVTSEKYDHSLYIYIYQYRRLCS